jgi:hypothetical protein
MRISMANAGRNFNLRTEIKRLKTEASPNKMMMGIKKAVDKVPESIMA